MKRIALTGGIGCGKTTVARMFQAHGIPVIDADEVVHILYNDPKIIEELTQLFGNEIYESGKINRQKLGTIIFEDEVKRATLTQFFQPRVNTYVNEKMNDYEKLGNSTIIYDATLIYEWGIENDFDLVIVVSTPLEERIKRICKRDNITEIDAHLRIQAQMPLAEKIKRADYVIINDQEIDKVQLQVHEIVEKLRLNL